MWKLLYCRVSKWSILRIKRRNFVWKDTDYIGSNSFYGEQNRGNNPYQSIKRRLNFRIKNLTSWNRFYRDRSSQDFGMEGKPGDHEWLYDGSYLILGWIFTKLTVNEDGQVFG